MMRKSGNSAWLVRGEGNRSTPMLVRMFFGRGLDQCAHPDRQYDYHRVPQAHTASR